MKKLLTITTILFAVAIMTGCGDSKPEAVPARSGLIGRWKGVDSNGKQYCWVDISESSIEVRWSAIEPQEFALYWRGTFPQTTDKTITSEVDQEALDGSNAIMPSKADILAFDFKSGQVSFETTAFGVNRTIHLKK